MKILLIAQHYYPDMVSSGLHMTELTTKWREKYPQDEISVFVAENSRSKEHGSHQKLEEYRGVTIHRVANWGQHHGTLFNRFLFSLGFSLKAFLFLFKNKKKYDILLITTNPPFLGITMLAVNYLLNLRYVLVVYDIYPHILDKLNILNPNGFVYRFWKWVNIKVYNNAAKIISIGRDMTAILEVDMQIAGKSKITLIHNWSDGNTVHPIPRDQNKFIIENGLGGKKILLYSGTLGSTHNIEDILEAAEELSKYDDILFLFIGSGAKVKLVENYIKFSANSNVQMLGFQPIESLSETLSSAALSFVCLDSAFTGLSVPSKSYGILASGVPILGLMDSSSEIALMVKENDCGIIWSSDSNLKLSEVIINVLNDELRLEEMKSNALKTFTSSYQIDISVEKYKLVANSVIN